MSFIVKNEDDKFLISFSKVKDDEFIILATNLKQFFVQKRINSEYIQEKFNESHKTIKFELSKILKIIQEEEPANDSELKVTGSDLNLVLKYQTVLRNMTGSFKISFKLEECTSIPEIGELFFTGLLKTIIHEKLKTVGSDKFNVNLPETSFEATFKVNDSNISDLCQFIGCDIMSKSDNTEQKPVEQVKVLKQSTKSTSRAVKRPIVMHNEMKFVQLNDSQEIDITEGEKPKEVTTKIVKNKKNIKF